jgi:type II secretory pathway pseudopilin PulG
MAALMAMAAVMVIGLAAAAPSWRYVMRNDREQELLFRGGQIADAIQRYQKRNNGALPPSMEVLVKGRFLRKAYKDPMTKKGEWRFIRQGQATALGATLGDRPGVSTTTTTTTTTTLPAGPAGGPSTVGGFLGVSSTSPEKSLRIFNGRQKYDEWFFVAGQPRVIGRRITPPGVPTGVPGAPGAPSIGISPTPLPAPRTP